MILLHEPYILPAMLDANLDPMGTGRTEGLHLSQIIKRMRLEAGEKLEDLPGEQPGLRAQIGFLWERAIEYAWKEYQGVTRPVDRGLQIREDGIHMSPDGLNREDGLIEEYKFTWKSRRKWDEAAEEEFWPWMVQVKGYARALGMTKVRFLVFWAGGAYFKGDRPQIGPWLTEFQWSREELDANWATVLRYRDVMQKEERDARAVA